jgi:hypothetical protein
VDIERLRALEKDIEATDRLVAKSRKLNPDIMYGRIFIKHRDTILSLIAELGQEVGAVGFVDIHGVARWYRPKGVSKQPEKGSLLFTSPPSSKPNAPAAWMVELNGEIVTLTDDAEEASSDARRFGARVVPLYTSPAHTSEARDAVDVADARVVIDFIFRHFGQHWNVGTALTDDVVAAVRRVEAAMRQEAGK